MLEKQLQSQENQINQLEALKSAVIDQKSVMDRVDTFKQVNLVLENAKKAVDVAAAEELVEQLGENVEGVQEMNTVLTDAKFGQVVDEDAADAAFASLMDEVNEEAVGSAAAAAPAAAAAAPVASYTLPAALGPNRLPAAPAVAAGGGGGSIFDVLHAEEA